jgi:hypothetical protein
MTLETPRFMGMYHGIFLSISTATNKPGIPRLWNGWGWEPPAVCMGLWHCWHCMGLYPHPPQKTLNHPNCWNQIVSENHWSFSLQHNQTIHKTSHLVTSCYIFQISSNSNGQRGPVFHCQASSINYVFFSPRAGWFISWKNLEN